METVILFGSPHRDGNTIQIVNALSDGLKQKGYNVRMLYLNDLNIRPCQGCYACIPKGTCKINDDMKDIRKYMIDSDLIVYATPVYWYGPSGQLKLAMDRGISFLDNEYSSRLKGKKVVTLMTCAEDNTDTFQPALDMFKKTFDLLGLEYAGSVEAPGCVLGKKIKKEFIQKVKKLAKAI
ncbi:MAG TPA: flavodoxin family protein [Syntrophorhabdus sp.]|mgnify:FL=1|jgi:multimeric flavodoxin WrbA|nr:flavodoxin family protein [Syntrophorhabdus sp.]OQB76267.1 MAG: putative NAD(P)H-dependent FMN-containing oxidoreductase YwqN [Deltaproteobacteria bacterium ADurb.Bin135]NMC94682.1 flavodoxin family protein [Syntrophorhabdus sp.]HOD77448.1 flavodoxin family protein [Syntrophorhabdus sp.]HQG26371.1 flavodoxin family protein [Syntrophorhabdus sp.]